MRLRVLKGLLWLVCGSHVALGLAGMLSPALAVDAVKFFYGANLDLTPVVIHMLRIVGAYMFTLGVMGGVAARNPEKHRAFVLIMAACLGIRVLQRLLFASEIEANFGALAAALVALLPRGNR